VQAFDKSSHKGVMLYAAAAAAAAAGWFPLVCLGVGVRGMNAPAVVRCGRQTSL
jgi:hypothetical protein